MLFEYAIEPQAICGDPSTLKYLSLLFGFDRGRLISRFPKQWEREVLAAADEAGIKAGARLELVERLNVLKQRALIKSRRNYDPALGGWLQNAIVQQAQSPFHAIIASENPGGRPDVVLARDVEEAHPLLHSPYNWDVERTPEAIARALEPLLRTGRLIRFVDPHFDIGRPKDTAVLKECLVLAGGYNVQGTRWEIHCKDGDDKKALHDLREAGEKQLKKALPNGTSIALIRWREPPNSDEFHDRFLLTERGGVSLGAGFMAKGAAKKVMLSVLAKDVHNARWAMFSPDSTLELVKPTLEFTNHDGTVLVREI
jgi:hypothetical protein